MAVDANGTTQSVTNGNENQNSTNTFTLPKKIAVLYSYVKRDFFETEALYITEQHAEKDAKLIASYVQKLGIECVTIQADENLIDNLKRVAPEMVFNLVESVRGSDYYAATVPAMLDFFDIPYTGADSFGFSFNVDKFLIKQALKQIGVPVPIYQLFNSPNDPLDISLRFPLISKLNEIHCAVEITDDAVSENEKHLRERIKNLMTVYKQPILVEEFIAGREVTSILLEGINKKVYSAEKVFTKTGKYVYTTFADQWLTDNTASVFKYEKYDDPQLREYVKQAFDAAKMVDYGKFDIRLDSSGRYYFIDANCNPAFGPKEMEVAISTILDMYGISFTEILRRLIVNTLRGAYTGEDFTNGNGGAVNGSLDAAIDTKINVSDKNIQY